MKLSGYRGIIEATFTDKMDIRRYVNVIDPTDGTTSTKLSTDPIHSDVPCRVSFTSSDNPDAQKEDINPIYLKVKAFCAHNADIKKGDKLTLRRMDDDGLTVLATYTGTANLPFSFVTHKELEILEIGEA